MSRKDRNWIVGSIVTAIALFTVFIARGDDEAIDWRRWQYRNQPEVYEAATAWIAARESLQVARAEWVRADSRARVPRGVAVGAGNVLVRGDAGIARALLDGAEASLATELARHRIDRPAYPIAVVLMVDTTMNPGGHFYTRATVLPSQPDEPCTVVVRFQRPATKWNRSAGQERLLGPCGFFAKYGAPGAGMLEYLRSNTMRTAEYLWAPTPWFERDALMPASYARSWPALAGCRAGRDSACLAVLAGTSPMTGYFGAWDDAQRGPNDVSVDGPLLRSGFYDRVSGGLLANLATSLGDDRFARLWRDARGPHVAYEAIAGEPLTAWMQRVVAGEVEPYRPGPGVPAVPLAATLFILGGAGFAAMRGTRRSMS